MSEREVACAFASGLYVCVDTVHSLDACKGALEFGLANIPHHSLSPADDCAGGGSFCDSITNFYVPQGQTGGGCPILEGADCLSIPGVLNVQCNLGTCDIREGLRMN